jgi:hypothetical protein
VLSQFDDLSYQLSHEFVGGFIQSGLQPLDDLADLFVSGKVHTAAPLPINSPTGWTSQLVGGLGSSGPEQVRASSSDTFILGDTTPPPAPTDNSADPAAAAATRRRWAGPCR